MPLRAWAEAPAPLPPAPPASLPAPAPTLRPALWKVADADTTIWLFGTVHVLAAGNNWYAGPVAAALESADEVVTEALDPSGIAAQQAMLARSMLPKGETLRAGLPASDARDYEALLVAQGLKPEAFDRFKPWFAAVTLTTLPLVRRGISPADGVEATIAAKAAAKPRLGLETVDEQLALLDGLPRAVQLAWLMQIVHDFDRIESESDALFTRWGKGDVEALASLASEAGDDPILVETLLLKRNRTWAGWIRERLARPGTVFIGVGAAHLAGKGSVQDDLLATGVMVERVQ